MKSMRPTLTVLAMLLLAIAAPIRNSAAQGSIVVTVTSDSGVPMRGAMVDIVRDRTVTRRGETDASGRVTFDSLPPAHYTIRARALGFESRSTTADVVIGQAATVTFVLKVMAPLQATLVTASYPPRSPWGSAVRLAYNFTDADAVDNIEAAAQTRLQVLGRSTHRFGTYVFGNFSQLSARPATSDTTEANNVKLRRLQESGQGFNVSVVPNLFWGDSTDNSVTLYATLGYRAVGLTDTVQKSLIMSQGVGGLGVAFTFLKGHPSNLPVQVTLGSVITFFSGQQYQSVFRQKKSSISVFEAGLIFPVGAGLGFSGELTVPFTGGNAQKRFGLVLAPQ